MTLSEWSARVWQSANDLLVIAASWFPYLAFLLLSVVVARVAAVGVRVMFQRLGIDRMAERLEVDQAMQSIGIRQSLSVLLSRVVYLAILLVLVLASVDVLGLGGLSDAVGVALGYVPRMLAALLVGIAGVAAAQFVRRGVARVARDSGIEFASSLGAVAFGATIFVAAMTMIAQLGIETTNLWLLAQFVVGGLTLAFGLSFGLGTRDLTQDLVAGFYARQTLEIGREVELRGHRGVLRAITPTQAIVEQPDGIVILPNRALSDEGVKQFTH